ncbi:unannotated protein [freshwater metagenome]|uniref:Unannotated protein n=1 Tax=freshwater metagenome TaxID=449393 RepID=A0A6J7EB60_9ZZZZ|nr:hypothetical protein [Actinomycetota bacterium]
MFCQASAGCQRDRIHAATTLRAAVIDVRDDLPPSISAVAGTALAGGWIEGVRRLSFEAHDGAGVRRVSVSGSGLGLAARDLPCDVFAMAPCPAAVTQEVEIDTGRLPDGPQDLLVRALDAGANETVQRVPVAIDNVAPTAAAPQIVGGEAWRSDPMIHVTVDVRDGDGGSGVQSLSWELCPQSGDPCAAATIPGAPSELAIQIPAAGIWRLRLTGADALRSGAPGPWSDPIRFDDTVPPAPQVELPAGWTAARAPLSLSLAPAQGTGPSGVDGYALVTGDGDPGSVAALPGPRAQARLEHLPEGVTVVRVRAISGAGVPGAIASALVRVDRTAPAVVLAGAGLAGGEQWLGRAAVVTAQARDQDGLSGMDGGSLEIRIDDEPLVRRLGPRANITIADDGIHVLTVRAYDAAGNASDPASLTVRVDRHAPEGRLLPLSDEAPRRLTATVDEGCIAAARLMLRRAGTVTWHRFDATAAAGAVSATIPDDRLAAGRYQVRLQLTDCAGNSAAVDRWEGRSGRATLQLPLRTGLRLAAGLAGPNAGAATATLPVGTPVIVEGRLLDRSGDPVAGRTVRLAERVGAGEWRVVRSARTQADGRLRIAAGSGPSRRLRLVVPAGEISLGAVSPQMRVIVPAQATIAVDRTVLRNGETARFHGRVLGGHLPAAGRELELQGYNPLRGRWQPVRTEGLRCDRYGWWYASYRFTATVGSTVTYRFRLRVAPHPDHPFAEGRSREVAITVRG